VHDEYKQVETVVSRSVTVQARVLEKSSSPRAPGAGSWRAARRRRYGSASSSARRRLESRDSNFVLRRRCRGSTRSGSRTWSSGCSASSLWTASETSCRTRWVFGSSARPPVCHRSGCSAFRITGFMEHMGKVGAFLNGYFKAWKSPWKQKKSPKFWKINFDIFIYTEF